MLKKITLATTLLCALSNYTFSQNNDTQTIRGIVVDAASDYPLMGATVELVTDPLIAPIGTVTDIDGRFELKHVPLGRQSFICKFIGYKDHVVNDFWVVAGKEGVINFQLEEDAFILDEIVIYNRKKGEIINEMESLSVNRLAAEEIIRFSGTLGDISRMAQNYAGVGGATDDRNDIIVRGNSPSSVLWRLEGVDIPSPNHWATLGTTGGPVSMLNTNNLSTSAFLSGAFPAAYGNVTGAVFDLKLRNGNAEEYEFLGQVGFNGFELGAEGPIKGIGNNASFLINYRYAMLQLLADLGIDFGTGGAVPRAQDVNFKLDIPTKNAGRFSFWGLGGISDITFLASENGEGNLYSASDENTISGSTTRIFGMNHKYFFNERTSSAVSLASSKAKNRNTIETESPTNPNQFEQTFDGNSTQIKTTINWAINSKINSRNLIKIGANSDFYQLRVLDTALVNNSFWYREKDFNGSLGLYRLFGQWEYKFSDKLKMNTGINTLFLDLNNSWTVEPRFKLSYIMDDKNVIALACGKYSQMQPLPIYFSNDVNATPEENALNKELDFIKSDHYVLSYTHHFTNKLRLQLETYYQDLSSIAVDPKQGAFSALNIGADFTLPNNTGLLNKGTGENYGLEFTLQQNLNKGFYYLLTTSWFQSKYKGHDGIERNTYYNSNYVVNMLVGKEWHLGKNLSLIVDSKFTYSGGRRYTPINLQASIVNDREIQDHAQAYSMQYQPYIRPDIKIGVKLNGKKITQTMAIDLQNFIGRKNVFIQTYNRSSQSITTLYQRGFFPDVRYQIVF